VTVSCLLKELQLSKPTSWKTSNDSFELWRRNVAFLSNQKHYCSNSDWCKRIMQNISRTRKVALAMHCVALVVQLFNYESAMFIFPVYLT